MRARLIVTTIVMAGLALAVGAIALAGKPAAPDTSKYPDLRAVVPDHLNLVNQQQNEYLRFSNGIANTGAGPWAMRPENAARLDADDDRDPGDPLVQRAVPLRHAAEAERPVLHDPRRAGRVDLRVPPDAQPLAYGRRRPLRGAQGQPDRQRRRRELDQGRLLPPRPLQPRRQRADEREGVLGLLHELPGRLSRAGSTSTTRRPTASRST